MINSGCACQKCGRRYKVDVMVPEDLWEIIMPKTNGAGLLCGSCIMAAIEAISDFDHFNLVRP